MAAHYRRKDGAYRAAREQGYRSRAALKLKELDKRFHLFRPGLRVVDLGCWPGGWLQVVAGRIGPNGRLVGVDLEITAPLGLPNVTLIRGDVRDATVRNTVIESLGGPADLLLSDLAPKLTGIKVADAVRQTELVETAVTMACGVLSSDGRVLIKLFSDVEAETIRLMAGAFASVSAYRPPSSRKGTSEIYAFGEKPRSVR